MTTLLNIVDQINEVGSRLSEMDDLLSIVAESNTHHQALYGVVNLANSAKALADDAAEKLDRIRTGKADSDEEAGADEKLTTTYLELQEIKANAEAVLFSISQLEEHIASNTNAGAAT